jgi:sugar phosphate permease
MNDTAKKAWGYRYVILFVVWLLYLINYFDRISVLTLLPLIQKDLSLSAVEIGWLGSIFFFGYACAQFTAGYFADKFGPKKTMNIAIWVFTLVTGITGFVQNLTQFIILRLGLAVGEGHHYVPSVRAIANWFPTSEKGRANAFLATTWAVAPAIVPIMVTWMAADWFGGAWRPVFFVLAVPGILGIWILYQFVSDLPKDMLAKGKMTQEEYDLITASVGADVSAHGRTYSSKMFTTDIQFYLYTISWFIMLMIYWGMTTWISTFLVKQRGLNLKTMGLYASMPFVVAFFSMYLGGWLADKLFQGKPKVVTMISFMGCIPVLYMIGSVPKGETGMLLLALALGGFFINLAWGVMQAFPSMRYPKEVVGRAMGVTNGVGQFGSFISPLIAGYLVVTAADGSFSFTNVFIFWSILAFIGTVCVSFLKEKSVVEHTDFETQK